MRVRVCVRVCMHTRGALLAATHNPCPLFFERAFVCVCARMRVRVEAYLLFNLLELCANALQLEAAEVLRGAIRLICHGRHKPQPRARART